MAAFSYELFDGLILGTLLSPRRSPCVVVVLKIFVQRVEAFTLPSSVNNFTEVIFEDCSSRCFVQQAKISMKQTLPQ